MAAPHLVSFFTPRVCLRAVLGNVVFAARHPRIFAALLLQALRSRRAFVRLLRLPVDLATIRDSALFDKEWYLRNRPDVARSGIPPELAYLLHEVPDGRWSSPRFSGDAYLELNPEPRADGLNPLVHYEQYGRFIGCPATPLDAAPPVPSFPEGAREAERDFGAVPAAQGRTAVFAVYSADGRLPPRDLLYLRALREVCDNVVLVCNAPLFPDELDGLFCLASLALCRWHGGYDFGSYRIGLAAARGRGWLAPEVCRELVFANDSCYAPVRPFGPMFRAMERRRADFWGLTFNTQRSVGPHLQSFFLVFRQTVVGSSALEDFFAARPSRITRLEAIERFEIQLTAELRSRGFVPDAFVRPILPRLHEFNPTTRPLDLIRRHKSPLVKVKALRGETSQAPERIVDFVRRLNPELAALMRVAPPAPPRTRTPAEAAAERAARAAEIGARVRAGAVARVLFLVSSPAMFPARPLLDALRADPAFAPRLAVIPDLRWPGRDPAADMAACERELAADYPALLLPPLRPGADGQWPDVVAGFDLVVYPLPYEFSDWRYNPMRADDAGVLGLHVNYGFYRSVYDRSVLALESYARFWKVFVECPATLEEFRAHACGGGGNAELVGYVKMDRLATCAPSARRPGRKRVLVCPHHSVEGGANDTLALSNFERYADFLLALPGRLPDIDFVLRPHPFLFRQLSARRRWGRARAAAWREAWLARDNAFWSDGGDYFPEFAAADAIVQDCGSYLVEWFFTGRPCCYMLKSEGDFDKFAPLGRDCLRHCHLAYDESAIEDFLREVVLGGRDDLAASREAFRQSVMVNYPHAADAALLALRQGLGI